MIFPIHVDAGKFSICQVHNWLIGLMIFLIAINFALLAALVAFAGQGERHTAEEGFNQDMFLYELDAKQSNTDIVLANTIEELRITKQRLQKTVEIIQSLEQEK